MFLLDSHTQLNSTITTWFYWKLSGTFYFVTFFLFFVCARTRVRVYYISTKIATMFPQMWSELVGGQSVKFHSQVAYFCVCISLSAFGVGRVLSVQPWSLNGNYLGVFFPLLQLLPLGAITEASTSNFACIKMNFLGGFLKSEKKNAGSTAAQLLPRQKKEVMKYLYLIASQQDKSFCLIKMYLIIYLSLVLKLGECLEFRAIICKGVHLYPTQSLENPKRVEIWCGEGYYSCHRPH